MGIFEEAAIFRGVTKGGRQTDAELSESGRKDL